MQSQLATAVLLTAMGVGSIYAMEKIRVDVYICNHDDSSILLGPGKVLASDLFAKVGVRVDWHAGELGPVGRDGSQPTFGIHTIEHAPESASPGALASARLVDSSATEITVYKDRIRRFLDQRPSLTAVAAGYLLAHELAHAMQGVARHSEAGIMKAQWSRDDFQQMVLHKLGFTGFDVDLIHRGLTLQLAILASETADTEKR
jgi:hypothetical protein